MSNVYECNQPEGKNDNNARLTDSYGRAINDLYPSMSCIIFAVQCLSVSSLHIPVVK